MGVPPPLPPRPTSVARDKLGANNLPVYDDRFQSASVENHNGQQQMRVPDGQRQDHMTLNLMQFDVVSSIDRKRERVPNFPFHGHYKLYLFDSINDIHRGAGLPLPYPAYEKVRPGPDNGELFYFDEYQRCMQQSAPASAGAAPLTLIERSPDAMLMREFDVDKNELGKACLVFRHTDQIWCSLDAAQI